MLRAYYRPFSVKSDFARAHAAYVGCAASLGLITTQHISGSFGHSWYVTEDGIRFLKENFNE